MFLCSAVCGGWDLLILSLTVWWNSYLKPPGLGAFLEMYIFIHNFSFSWSLIYYIFNRVAPWVNFANWYLPEKCQLHPGFPAHWDNVALGVLLIGALLLAQMVKNLQAM